MKVHSVEKIQQLKRLRGEGYSIKELVAELDVPQATVWHHVHKIKILPDYQNIWKAKRGGSAKRAQRNRERAKELAHQLLGGPNRDLVIALAMLYWAEGRKNRCDFINTDGEMIKSYLGIIRKTTNILEDSIKPTLRIFSGMDEGECLEYWSQITKIPKQNFRIRLNDGGTRSRTRHGMCRIEIKKGGIILKLIQALIEEIRQEIIDKVSVL
ncbi:MAG: hypothetical protein PHN39_01140 [Candidatus Pacebacteria bacterium]|nr:hypothetical protein [Candidatus Paceibacterota bacterium]